MFYLGVDVGKFFHSLCLLNGAGQEAKIWQMTNDRVGFSKLKERLLKEKISLADLLIGMEATGHYFLNLYEFLLELGIQAEQIALLNPLQVKSFRNTNLRGAKSDNVDAERIAVLLRFGGYKRCNVAVNDIMNLRELSRLRADLTASGGNLKRKLIAVLDRIFPEFAKIFKNQFGVTALTLLQDYSTPEELAQLSLKELQLTIKKLSKRGLSASKVKQLYEASKNSIGISFGQKAFKIELQIILQQLAHLEEQIDFLKGKIETIVKKLDSPIFTIPGVGPTTGATILSEIGDINNFPSATKLIAFAGLDPKLKESGTYQGRTPISKRGSKYLRTALWYAAMVACRVESTFKKQYQARREKGKSHRYAVTSAANKLTKIVYHILKYNCTFDSKQLA
ncbi:IS110 family transposase [Patescibacteria group bacterium]|nr:IS110 family transposase [Patescibacteria group bacterium]MCG2687759.1 IS110 family transposase [Candidatus Parcubacteria bacterium]MCG2692981.1 IS110 family transposase [Candidatus Parcubacteria bacterium]